MLGLHVRGARGARPPESELSLNDLKRYIAYARARCAPRLSKEASGELADHYVRVRSNMRAKDGQLVAVSRGSLMALRSCW